MLRTNQHTAPRNRLLPIGSTLCTLMVGLGCLITVVLAGAESAASPGELLQPLPQLKAAYYLNTLKFTRWRTAAMPDEPINIVVLGQGDVADILVDELPLHTVANRDVTVIALCGVKVNEEHPLPNSLIEADAIYFAASTKDSYRDIIRKLDRSILTTSSIPEFATNGGMVEIADHPSGQQLKFRINTHALKESGILIHSQLLNIAEIIGPRTD